MSSPEVPGSPDRRKQFSLSSRLTMILSTRVQSGPLPPSFFVDAVFLEVSIVTESSSFDGSSHCCRSETVWCRLETMRLFRKYVTVPESCHYCVQFSRRVTRHCVHCSSRCASHGWWHCRSSYASVSVVFLA